MERTNPTVDGGGSLAKESCDSSSGYSGPFDDSDEASRVLVDALENFLKVLNSDISLGPEFEKVFRESPEEGAAQELRASIMMRWTESLF